MNLTAVQKAYGALKELGVRGVLVGTAALQLRGYKVEAPDVDFLCERSVDEDFRTGYGSGLRIDGTCVDCVGSSDEGRDRFFHPERADVIAGVPVAALEDVLGLKRWRDREKDREFFKRWDAGEVGRW